MKYMPTSVALTTATVRMTAKPAAGDREPALTKPLTTKEMAVKTVRAPAMTMYVLKFGPWCSPCPWGSAIARNSV